MEHKRLLQVGVIDSPTKAMDIIYDSLNLASTKGIFDLNQSGLIRDSVVLLVQYIQTQEDVKKDNVGNG